MENLLNKIFPPKCLFCGHISALICENCLKKCIVLNKTYILEDPAYKFNLNAHCIYEYSTIVRDCIRKSKFYSKQFAALKLLSLAAIHLLTKNGKFLSDAVLVPIPSSKPREQLRGFNHVDIIADTFGKYLKIPVETKLLIKTKNTGFQYEYTRYERFQNVRDAFQVRQLENFPTKVILVDDICTTGATFLEASNTLYTAGVKEITCIALSKKL
jgi:competence protein ComFC